MAPVEADERWRALPWLQVRTPALLPADLAGGPGLADPDRLPALWAVPALRAAVAQAAPGLAAAIGRELERPGPGRDRLTAALHRYAVRATTRATPRGLLAAAGYTRWGEPEGQGRLEPHRRAPADPVPGPVLVAPNPSLRAHVDRLVEFQVPGEEVQRQLRLPGHVLAALAGWREPCGIPDAPVGAADAAALLRAGVLVDSARPSAPDGRAGDEIALRWVDPPPVPATVRARIEPAVTALSRIGQALPADPAILRYAAAYEAVFGDEQVALDRVVDPVTGLGRPGPPETPRSPQLEDLLVALVDRAGATGAAELYDADLARLPRVRPPVAGCDVFVQLAGDALVLTPRGVTAPAGRAHARFADLGPGAADVVAAAARHEQASDPAADRAILDYWHDAMIDLAAGAAPEVPVLLWSSVNPGRESLRRSDLGFAVADGVPRLTVLRTGRRVEIHPHHLVDTAGAPWLLHLIHRISACAHATPGWTWGRLAQTHVRLPRVSYAGVVLAAARWRLPEPPVPDEALDQWRARHTVPRRVRLDDGDLGVLVDLDSPADRDLLRRAETTGPQWVLEAFDVPGERVRELVVPLLRDLPPAPAPATTAPASRAGTETEVLPPGERWWSIHLPTRDVDQENVVLRLLGAYLGGLPWFFVRYNVPAAHLRIRVAAADVDAGELATAARRICGASTGGGFTIEGYRREPGRFGGPAALERVETVFCADAAACLPHLDDVARALRGGVGDSDGVGVAAVLLDRAIRGLGAAEPTGRRVLDGIARAPVAGDRSARAHEHAQRRLLRGLLSGPLVPGPVTGHLAPAGHLSDTAVRALVHLHLNRLGCDRDTEALAAARLLAAWRSVRP